MRLKFSILYFLSDLFGVVQWCNAKETEYWNHAVLEGKSLVEIREYVAVLLNKGYEVDVTIKP